MNGLFSTIRSLLSLRWQLPLAVAALAVAGATVYRLRPEPRALDVDSLLAEVLAMEQAGAYRDAIDSTANLLQLDPPLPKAQRATLHRLLGEMLFRQEARRRVPLAHNLLLLLDHEADAVALGAPDNAALRLRLAWAHESLRDRKAAAEQYRAALLLEPAADERRAAQTELVRLLAADPHAADERAAHLNALLGDQGVSPLYVAWALHRGIEDALAAADVPGAESLLTDYGGRLRHDQVRGYLEYMNARVLFAGERFDEAAPLIAWVEEWLSEHDREENRIEQLPPLGALNRWLSGLLQLAEQRPQSALQDLQLAFARMGAGDAVPRDASELFFKAAIARARALAMLERHDEARDALLADARLLRRDVADPRAALLGMRTALVNLFDERYQQQDYEHALGYMTAAARIAPADAHAEELKPSPGQLLESIATAHVRAAEASPELVLRGRHYAQAGQHFEEAALADRLNPVRNADLTWEAAQMFDAAGDYPAAQRALRVFLNGRAGDPRVPTAMLQLGHSLEAAGDLAGAVAQYEQLLQQYPRLPEAKRAQFRSAECLLAIGGPGTHSAGERLEALLHDDTLSPSAAIYHDALLALCDLLYLESQHSEAIARLENFLTLYPEDADATRARFMLADVYRRSALDLRDHPPANVSAERAAEESGARLRSAAQHFEALHTQLEALPADAAADPQVDLYRRLSLAYRGDCLIELNESASLEEALATFRQIAARYEDDPAALNAQVQIANIYLRQGQVVEASRAVERARWLLRNMSDQSFAAAGAGQTRADWDKYLTTVASSALLGGALNQTADSRKPPGAFP